MELKTLKQRVEYILENEPSTRNCDIGLMIAIWKRFYGGHIIMLNGDSPCVLLEGLYKLPREDNIKRIRAKIQNEEKRFLPTDPAVAEKRGIKRYEWLEFMGYATGNRNQISML